MSSIDVNLSFQQAIGSRGSGAGQFNYPRGLAIAQSKLFVCDSQNHRINAYDLSGTFLYSFGSFGTGNTNFSFPTEITVVADFTLVIVDQGNHRIVKYDHNGNYSSQFGTEGSGAAELKLPSSIYYYNNSFYIADRGNNRIKKTSVSGLFQAEVTGLPIPESLCVFQNRIYVILSGNDTLKIYDTDLVFEDERILSISQGQTIRPSADVFAITDRGKGCVKFYDNEINEVRYFGSYGPSNDQFGFPFACLFHEETFFVSDVYSTSHKVKAYNIAIETGIEFLNAFKALSSQLLPTGRAWWLKLGSVIQLTFEALSLSESRVFSSVINLQADFIPDSDKFSEHALVNWETVFAIAPSGGIEDRKNVVYQRMAFPSDVLARQSRYFIEMQLQLAGFDVYVFENRFPDGGGGYEPVDPQPALHDVSVHDEQVHDGTGFGNYSIIANSLAPSGDASFKVTGDELRSTFFIGGPIFGDQANVSIQRERELRELVLKLKPAQTVVFALINYI